jgi:sialate O-acetylesterase
MKIMNSTNQNIVKNALFAAIFTFCFSASIFAGDYDGDWERIINLSGKWKFSIGDDNKWAQPNYKDDDWERIYVPAAWEDQGFHGYDGYAWYRKQFYFPQSLGNESIYFRAGAIDDVDEVYVNGQLIGSSGTFPPNYKSAYNAMRIYFIPSKYLNMNGNNTIAVRVYDSQLAGGIVWGDVGIYINHSIQPDINLEGKWKFRTGNSPEWKNKDYNDNNWDLINVPSYWENQGYKDYDGYAWYRIKVYIPDKFKNKQLILVLGMIDDMDAAYFNGKEIGSTGGQLYDDQNTSRINFDEAQSEQSWQKFRGYYIPADIIAYNQNNTIAVKVYDGYINGGIYQGPIGVVTQERYTRFWHDKRKRDDQHKKNFFELIFGE